MPIHFSVTIAVLVIVVLLVRAGRMRGPR